jgi:hypothetical protein
VRISVTDIRTEGSSSTTSTVSPASRCGVRTNTASGSSSTTTPSWSRGKYKQTIAPASVRYYRPQAVSLSEAREISPATTLQAPPWRRTDRVINAALSTMRVAVKPHNHAAVRRRRA